MASADVHKARYSDAVGFGDLVKRLVWNRLPSRFRLLMHEMSILDSRVHELEMRQMIAIPTTAHILDQTAVQNRLIAIEELLIDVTAKLTEMQNKTSLFEAKIAELQTELSTVTNKVSVASEVQRVNNSSVR